MCVCVFSPASTHHLAHQGISAVALLMQREELLSAVLKAAGEERKRLSYRTLLHSQRYTDSLNGIEVCLCRLIRLATDPH